MPRGGEGGAKAGHAAADDAEIRLVKFFRKLIHVFNSLTKQ